MDPARRHAASRAHLALGDRFFDVVEPARFPRQVLRFKNERWAERIGLELDGDAAWERHFARFEPLDGSLEAPIALRYHGHQFGVYNPALGDGRGFLFAQLVEPVTGRLLDLGTKGSGKTPWSRGGDGRLTLKGGMREVLATEMLEALGVPTSKSFSLFETGEALMRGDEPSPTRSSVLVRLSHSHIRFGTFQRLAFHDDLDGLTKLVDHCVEHYYPEIADARDRPLALLSAVAERTADLAASYDVAGFVHGVLNTDNMNITGESFDYGPYRFLQRRDPSFVAAYFDQTGLYAFGRQTETMRWNLGRLADALRPIATSSPLGRSLDVFAATFASSRARRFVDRLGVRSQGVDADSLLCQTVLAFLEGSEVTMDRFFFDWHAGEASHTRAFGGRARAHYEAKTFEPIRRLLEVYEPACGASLSTPYFAREAPTTLPIPVIEDAWQWIDRVDDWTVFEGLVHDIRELGAQCRECLGGDLKAS